MGFPGKGSDFASLQLQVLNPLCQAGDRTCIPELHRHHGFHCTTAGTLRLLILSRAHQGLFWRLECMCSFLPGEQAMTVGGRRLSPAEAAAPSKAQALERGSGHQRTQVDLKRGVASTGRSDGKGPGEGGVGLTPEVTLFRVMGSRGTLDVDTWQGPL